MVVFDKYIRSFVGRRFSYEEIALVCEVVKDFPNLSRSELAGTVCELLEWERPNGELKRRECRDFLETLEAEGLFKLPEKGVGMGRPTGSATSIDQGGIDKEVLEGSIEDFGPLVADLADDTEKRRLFRNLIGNHHYLGYRVPFGARLQYLIWASKPERQVVAAMQFSSAAWRMAARDKWVGWSDSMRAQKLPHVVNQSRFLVLPWFRIRNLASAALRVGAKALQRDWPEKYKTEPWLLETLVDTKRYTGTCYRAANWISLGATCGRGRMDKEHARHGESPKTIFVYPLHPKAQHRLSTPEAHHEQT